MESVNTFKDVSSFACQLPLILVYSKMEVERLCSQVNVIKTKLRNRFSTEMTSSILYIVLYRAGLSRTNKCCGSYDFPNEIINKCLHQKP